MKGSPLARVARGGQALRGATTVALGTLPLLPRLLPAAVRHGPSLAAVLAGRAMAHDDRPVWVDERGALDAATLWQRVHERSSTSASAVTPAPGTAIVLQEEDQLELVVGCLAGLLRDQHIVVVPHRAGREAWHRAHAESRARARPPARRGGTLRLSTSGTTGPPRSVTQRGGPATAVQGCGILGAFPVLRRPVIASASRVDHGQGFALWSAALLLGGCYLALPPDPTDAARLLTTTVAHLGRPVDLLSGVPLQLGELARVGVPEGVVARVLSGSDVLTAATARRVEERLRCPLHNAYGATETGTVAVASPADRRVLPGTVGRPVPGVRVRVVDEAGAPCPPGVEGRLLVRSALLSGPPFSGDRGWVDRHGRLVVTGRADGVRVTGGENADPDRLVRHLRGLPGVLDVTLSEVPDARFGSRLSARLVVRAESAGAPPFDDVEGLRSDIREALGPALVPARIVVLSPEPGSAAPPGTPKGGHPTG